jgi:hypothetical protein
MKFGQQNFSYVKAGNSCCGKPYTLIFLFKLTSSQLHEASVKGKAGRWLDFQGLCLKGNDCRVVSSFVVPELST